jgi:hypothetical protein
MKNILFFSLLLNIHQIYAINFKITNNCIYPINIYSNENRQFINKCNLNTSNNCNIQYNSPYDSGLFKTSLSEQSTLFEFSITGPNNIWYDISVIPPGSGVCNSYKECFSKTNKLGFNMPLSVKVSKETSSCKNLICLDSQCQDAYLYPYDDTKTKFCNANTEFNLIYCPSENNNTVETTNNNNLNYSIDCN